MSILFSNVHFYSVVGKNIILNVLNHSLQAPFIVNFMQSFSQFLYKEGSNDIDILSRNNLDMIEFTILMYIVL
ncbi:hypothetical protein EDL79_00615 [Ehrlichia ruminantium]|uniref:Uncharacterized protein n=1 Tax=Ehrlichia ruminantium TaxID=779 RepID=A0AAE6UI63_EHRRU|nr:hypothetical protein [Ehrlichia ruminantium]QGR02197.1 hypothetical protein EDL81_00615 [Ehrlichia ruminantium]QGR03119.1 hypothetical protein EDL80_00615 [Ehrlichia ruminantium]QGR04044.1 hypothetical protein EDL79_00615 [Ehrlichia ruminantium]